MVAKQRIRMANEKHSKNITQRGNVAKTSVRESGHPSPCRVPGAEARASPGRGRGRGRGEFSPDPPDSGLPLRWNLGWEERSVSCPPATWLGVQAMRAQDPRVVSLRLKLFFFFLFAEKCPRRKGVGRTLVIGPLHFCCLWLW